MRTSRALYMCNVISCTFTYMGFREQAYTFKIFKTHIKAVLQC